MGKQKNNKKKNIVPIIAAGIATASAVAIATKKKRK